MSLTNKVKNIKCERCGCEYSRPRPSAEVKAGFPNCPECAEVGGIINYPDSLPSTHYHTDKLLDAQAEELWELLKKL